MSIDYLYIKYRVNISILAYLNSHNGSSEKEENILHVSNMTAPYCEKLAKTPKVIIRFECADDTKVCFILFLHNFKGYN